MLTRTSIVACLFIFVACAHQSGEQKTDGPASAPVAEAPPPVHKAPDGAPPKAQLAGTVAETFDSAQYTYMRVTLDSGDEVWAAATSTPIKVGARVTMRGFLMRDFHASSLDRTFAEIYFVDSLAVEDAAAPDDMI